VACHSQRQSTEFTGKLSRRSVFEGMALATAASLVPLPALAAKGPAKPEELARIRKGYEGLEYLLANFDKETTKCNPECNRNPDAVRSYLGLRSMEHPLYQIEKVFHSLTIVPDLAVDDKILCEPHALIVIRCLLRRRTISPTQTILKSTSTL